MGIKHTNTWKFQGGLKISRTWKNPGHLEISRAPGNFKVSWKFPGGSLISLRTSSEGCDVATMMAEKNLKLNEDKCVMIAMGTKKQREKVKVDIETNPMRCGDFEMKLVEQEKCLRRLKELLAVGL